MVPRGWKLNPANSRTRPILRGNYERVQGMCARIRSFARSARGNSQAGDPNRSSWRIWLTDSLLKIFFHKRRVIVPESPPPLQPIPLDDEAPPVTWDRKFVFCPLPPTWLSCGLVSSSFAAASIVRCSYPGRHIGSQVGQSAFALAEKNWNGTIFEAPVEVTVDFHHNVPNVRRNAVREM